MLLLNPQQIPYPPSDNFQRASDEGEQTGVAEHISKGRRDSHDPCQSHDEISRHDDIICLFGLEANVLSQKPVAAIALEQAPIIL